MDTVKMKNESLSAAVLQDVMKRYGPPAPPLRTMPVFDAANGNYLLVDEGWDGFRRIHHFWVHIEERDGKYWIHEDGTEEGIARYLLNAGVPADRIVLAFQEPALRTASAFAVA